MVTRKPAVRVPVVRDGRRGFDEVVTEEPLQIRAGGMGAEPVDVAVTMRTPGHDFELAVGYLVGEGHVHAKEDVVEVRFCVGPDQLQDYNVVTVGLRAPFTGTSRQGVVASSCGLCGKRSIDEVRIACASAVAAGPTVPLPTLVALPDALRTHQKVFDRTGGVHAAGLFDADGGLVVVREDVGRHNAVDKVVGWALLEGRVPLSSSVLVLSGRASFEMVQKAALAGVPIVVAVSAPSSLAVEAADHLGITLLGFTSNVYTHAARTC